MVIQKAPSPPSAEESVKGGKSPSVDLSKHDFKNFFWSGTDKEKIHWKIGSKARIGILGPSNTGKSTIIHKLIHFPQVWENKLGKVLYCVPNVESHQKFLGNLAKSATMNNIDFYFSNTIPTRSELISFVEEDKNCLIIMDDVLSYNTKTIDRLTDIFIEQSNHIGFHAIYACQSLFLKEGQTLGRNCTHRFLTYNLGNKSSINTLNTQMFQGHKNFLQNCLKEAKEDLGLRYIFINSDPQSNIPERYSVYTALFPDERKRDKPLHFDLEENVKKSK